MDIKLDDPTAETEASLDSLPVHENRIVISLHGDLLVEYINQSTTISCRWQVSSQILGDTSPYFRALLDPEKFAEGRSIVQQQHAQKDGLNPTLPILRIPYSPLFEICDSGPITLFLKILCLDTMSDLERVKFETDLKKESPAMIAKLINIAEWFNSPDIVRAIVTRIEYSFGRTAEKGIHHKKKKYELLHFNTDTARMKEDTIRQIIFIAHFMGNSTVLKTTTHVLIVAGSRLWIDGLEAPENPADHLRWQYLPYGIEEELYYRRQCVLGTITDLQAHFLRVYGGLDDEDIQTKPKNTRSLGVGFSTSTQTTQFQCRAGMANGSQCDIFQLGQLTRFLTMRSKTAFIGSTILDPEFSLDAVTVGEKTVESPSSLSFILNSLKSFPDYQIDSHHGSCGVRRRLMPIIPCIEKYVMDPRALLGIKPLFSPWSKSPKDFTVNIHFGNITSIDFPDPQTGRSTHRHSIGIFPEEDAELLFTVKKRNWET
ncbi:hypothetical protein N7495_002210 [Penicillium taxi]|uniref:uncharacterized protein n=1 Tax=Penicillium taxi TaxID=168475 RepID=UPI002544E0B3|nr:uncharacterized protein N7495_002210 [Penicillium taxi]KAJ5901682.1 hypothetical protein N7495_002210 [Penicillium taxi]